MQEREAAINEKTMRNSLRGSDPIGGVRLVGCIFSNRWGQIPARDEIINLWGQPPKRVPKTPCYSDILCSYRLKHENENSMRNILKLALLRSKKV